MKRKKKITDRERLDWFEKNFNLILKGRESWSSYGVRAKDSYFLADFKNIREAIDAAMSKEKS